MTDDKLRQELFLQRLRLRIDPRVVACELKVDTQGRDVFINGFTMFPQTNAFVRATAKSTFAGANLHMDLKVLASDYPIQFYEVIAPSARFYKNPRIKRKDMLTEALYGSVIRGFFRKGRWLFAQHADGYVGYVDYENLVPVDEQRYLRWKNGECALLRTSVKIDGVMVPPAARLIVEGNQVQSVTGKWAKVPERAVTRIQPSSNGFVRSLVRHAREFEKTPYLWGGKTQLGIDCSGFVQSLMLQEHILLPRDANMQAFVGEIVGYLPGYADLLPGDLLFFMNNKAHVFHVGIFIGNNSYMHSSGSRNVDKSSCDPEGDNYIARYGKTFAFARRVQPR